MDISKENRKILELLAREFPNRRAAFAEIINLQAILNLPKGTEHFLSDLHGEYEAFNHILNNCSGVIREKVSFLFGDTMTPAEQAEFCTLIYYPHDELERMKQGGEIPRYRYKQMLQRLIELTAYSSSKYTRSKVRRAMPQEFAFIIDELLHAQKDEDNNRALYHSKILDSIMDTKSADDFIVALCTLTKRLTVDRLHILGDIFDRGEHADLIMDLLMDYENELDIQWGNHDILWMGANGYGISMRNLVLFAEKTYSKEEGMDPLKKAISVLIFKLEGQLIKRHPEYRMENRLLLGQVDWDNYTITLDGVTHPLKTRDFPTVDPANPFRLSPEEKVVVKDLVHAFTHSVRLRQHVDFLYSHGSMYKCINENLLYHGCMPLDEDGNFARVDFWGEPLQGRAYLDKVDQEVRKAWSAADESSVDFLWYLWCGIDSPLFGRVIKTFERTYLEDKTTWKEPRNPYYVFNREKRTAKMILHEFGLYSERSHIINGHTPVNVKKGESPIRVIDGGFCKAYQKATGIAGYTLIFNSHGMKLKTHQPFESLKKALEENVDIHSDTEIVEVEDRRIMVGDTDQGIIIRERIKDLKELLKAYRSGLVRER